MTRYEELTPAQAFAAREAAMGEAEAHAAPSWRSAADHAVRWCAAELEDFTTDDVIVRMAAVGAPATPTLTALGPVMVNAARSGIICKTGEMRLTRLSQRHRDLTVWEACR